MTLNGDLLRPIRIAPHRNFYPPHVTSSLVRSSRINREWHRMRVIVPSFAASRTTLIRS